MTTCSGFDPASVEEIHRHHQDLIAVARQIEAKAPFSLFSAARLRRNIRSFRAAAEGSRLRARIHFAVKSSYVPGVLSVAAAGCDGLDVQSHHETELCPASSSISFHSPLFSAESLLDARLTQISLNTEAQHRALIARPAGRPLRVGFRIALPDFIEGQFIHRSSKFGMSDSTVARLLRAHRDDPEPPFIHHHTHARLQTEAEAEAVARCFVAQVKLLQDEAGTPVQSVDIGGGWDGAYRVAAAGSSVERLVRTQLRVLAEGLPDLTEVILEPGRSIAEDASITVATVHELIPSAETTYAVLDVATSFLVPLPLARFVAAPLDPLPGDSEHHYTLVDGTCSPRGQIAAGIWRGQLRPGSRVLIANCGAYTHSMRSSFHSDPPRTWICDEEGRLTDAYEEARANDAR